MASLNLDDFVDVHRDRHTGLLYTNFKDGRRVLLCSLCHFLSAEAEAPYMSMREMNTRLITIVETFVEEVRETGFSDFYIDIITDNDCYQWPVVGRRSALLFFKEVPPEQLQKRYSQLCSVLNDDLENASQQLDLAKQVGVWCFGNATSGPGVHLHFIGGAAVWVLR